MSGMIGCYVLDGFLILYGIILTVLYFRLKVRHATSAISHTNTPAVWNSLLS